MSTREYAYRKPVLRGLARLVDGVGDLLAPLLGSPRDPALHDVLVVRLDQLGDLVQTLPFFDALHAAYPDLQVDVLAARAGEEVLRGHPAVRRVVGWDCPWFRGEGLDISAFVWLARFARRGRYHTAVDLRGDVRVMAALRAGGVRDLVGFGATGGGFLLTREIPWAAGDHAVDRNLAVAAALGAPGTHRDPRWPRVAAPAPAGLPRRFLAIHPDAGTAAKRWPAAAFARVIEGVLAAREDLEVVLVGLNRRLGEDLRGRVPDARVRNLMGETSLASLVGVLDRAAGLLTNDSGPGHVAAALGRPVWVLWSGTAPAACWRPRGAAVTLFEHPVPCAPCALRTCPVAGHPCMTEIPPGVVLQAILRGLRDPELG